MNKLQPLLDQAKAIYQWACGFLKSLTPEKLDAGLGLVLRELSSEAPAFQEKFLAEISKAAGVSIGTCRKIMGTVAPQEEKEAKNLQGQAISFQEPEPWPECVDGAELLNELAGHFSRFAILPDHGANALALLVAFGYTFEAFSICPMLAILSPEKRCGKTLILELFGSIVQSPLHTSNITGAALFRTIEKFKPTLLIDEADSFLSFSEELRGILNSGHRRQTAFVIRTVGDEFEVRQFSTWCLKAVALIGSLPDTVEDRSITICMRRKKKDEKTEKFRPDRLSGYLLELRRKLKRWSKDNFEKLREADPDIPESLNDRAQDCWMPLLAIADIAGGGWPQKARKAALALSWEGKQEDDSVRVQLLADLREFFKQVNLEKVSTQKILAFLVSLEERFWGEWKHGKPLTSNLKTPLAEG